MVGGYLVLLSRLEPLNIRYLITLTNMPLVDYSSSSSSSKEESLTVIKVRGSRPIKRKRKSPTTSEHLPPLPSTFYDLYASSTRPSTQDDPELHGGRQRVTPHIEGSWPSHVYIECKSILTHPLSKADVIAC